MENSPAQEQPKPWSIARIKDWQSEMRGQGKVRDYNEIVTRLKRLPANTHTVQPYVLAVSGDEAHTAYRITVGDIHNGNPNILITGGVHGYEPSGVEAAIRFMEEEAPRLTDKFNFVAYPCIVPWAYEYDHRWNHDAEDPNRMFSFAKKRVSECWGFMNSVASLGVRFKCAIDLHETSDRDIELRQMRADRFGTPLDADFRKIPQGYYLTLSKTDDSNDDLRNLCFGTYIIEEVEKISPIAPEREVLGKTNWHGTILSPKTPGLMRTFIGTHADYAAVTEVYPDHPDMNPEKSVQAQLASIRGALRFCLEAV